MYPLIQQTNIQRSTIEQWNVPTNSTQTYNAAQRDVWREGSAASLYFGLFGISWPPHARHAEGTVVCVQYYVLKVRWCVGSFLGSRDPPYKAQVRWCVYNIMFWRCIMRGLFWGSRDPPYKAQVRWCVYNIMFWRCGMRGLFRGSRDPPYKAQVRWCVHNIMFWRCVMRGLFWESCDPPYKAQVRWCVYDVRKVRYAWALLGITWPPACMLLSYYQVRGVHVYVCVLLYDLWSMVPVTVALCKG